MFSPIQGGRVNRQPDYPAALNKIQNLPASELQQYLDDDSEAFERLIKSLDQVQSLEKEKEMLIASNKSIAEYNLSQESTLTERKNVLRIKREDALELVKKAKTLKKNLDSKAGKVKPDALLSLLEAANAEAEEKSELIAEQFLNGKETNIDEFIENFQEARKLAHMRRIKVDKLKELIRKDDRPSHSGIPNASLPYPTFEPEMFPRIY